MAKRFNITGLCIPAEHFIADISGKLDKIVEMIADGDYFTINRPRQYGKTTVMHLLGQRLQKDKNYLMIDTSFEGIDSSIYNSHRRFIQTLLDILKREFQFRREHELAASIETAKPVSDFNQLNAFITSIIVKANRKVVLMIDEVDKSGNNQLFLDFLGMLRTKYLDKRKGKDHTFHSVILAGVHDIKTLKGKIRPEEKCLYNSPWNIAVDFEVDLSLLPGEIAPMLEQYAAERKVTIDIPFFSERLFYFTSGYPFLVSLLCKIIDERILPGKKEKEWLPEDLVQAVQIALAKDNTNFETLIKNLENNPDLYEFVFDIIMNEKEFSYNLDNPIINLGVLNGILGKQAEKTKIHNRLYEQRIYNYMSSRMETSRSIKFDHVSSSYIDEDGALNLEKAIKKFQQFIKEQYSEKDTPFIERNGRLLFLAFIKPIINGRGFDFKEVQISEEKRLDIVITFEKQKYIVELKIWRGDSYHEEGILQLCDYLDRQNQNSGYLLIFDLRKETANQGKWETIKKQGKVIHAAWV